MNAKYPKKERLKSKKLIGELFEKGESITVYPIKLVYLQTLYDNGVVLKAGVSVSKKQFKKAVERNHIKRLLRESFRKLKPQYFNNITTQYAFMFLYIGNTKPAFTEVNEKMKVLLDKFSASI